LRVAFLTVGDTTRLTGGYLYHARLFEGLRERNVEVVEFVPCGDSVGEQEAASRGLAASFDPTSFDVVVVDALARVASSPGIGRWRRARPVVAMVHELPSVAGNGDPAFEEPLLRADRLVTVSRHGREVLRSRGVPDGRISVVPPGFDRLPARGTGEAEPPSLRTDAPRALCVAQWIERKDILTLVEAWTARERGGATLELVGDTDADPDYAAAVRDAIGTDTSITVTGPVDDSALASAYSAADLFVLPSRYEGYGVVYVEALAHGLPVVACEVGPVPGLVGREAALLVPPGDAAALSGALDLRLGAPERRARMSSAARRRAAGLPRWRDTVNGFEAVLRSVVAEVVA
jgi:glycosyltransferase involved in cell wall biosynthesis